MSVPTPLPPPGWYQDPQGGIGTSYWDGSQWHQEMRRRPMPWWVVTILSLLAVTVAAFVLNYVVSGPHQNVGKTIRYEVTGDSGRANNITYMINRGEQQDTNVSLPWSREFTANQGFQPLAVTAQNGESGAITCRILVDGKVVNQHTSNGQYAVVTCSASWN